MKSISIPPATLKFLEDLSKNNNREWFAENKARYDKAQEQMLGFVTALMEAMNTHDVLEPASAKRSLFRIYNDVRFSKDKSPYSARFACGFQRAGKSRRGGYTLTIRPGKSHVSCGFFAPNAEDLKRIRTDIAFNYPQWKKILNAKKMKEAFGELRGNHLLTAPRGFEKDQEGIEWIRHKQFILRHDFSDKEVLAPDFLLTVNKYFKTVRPFFDYMSMVLTTDANGEPLF